MFRYEVRQWLTSVASKYRATDHLDHDTLVDIRREWEGEVARSGYAGLSWPVEFGGKALGPIEEFVFSEECSTAKTPEELGRVGRLLVAPALFVHGTRHQLTRFLPPILQGTEIWCQGFSEPNAGSDLAGVTTSARRNGEHYVINGQKIWTSYGHYAQWCIVLARTGIAGSRHHGLTMIAVPMHHPGIEVRRIVQLTGSSEFTEVFFDEVEVPPDCVIGAENDGWAVALTILNAERGARMAALALKSMSDILALLDHCKGNHDEFQAAAVSLGSRLELARWHVMRSVERMASDRDPIPAASVIKIAWTELMQEAIRIGFRTNCQEHRDLWRYMELEARCRTISAGSSEIQRNIIAERILGLPR
jgi:alkylation response protein AidB-like acyl-CoA dehydrogenase